ncbi:phage protein Gp27 family protein [Thauera phenylacetica]|uniref:phage protein Gp27 family protein n=1 Tax=Thauera phenylacetica TaxID=164400 RepID=UPI001B7FE64A|nr:phage protein Gp27 family protein [Thauera phenylacetica]
MDKQSPGVRAHILRRLRENRLTLDELIADLHATFPAAAASGELPSRSALHRFGQGVQEIVAHEREMAAAAEALVAELGEEFDAKSGALLAQAVTTLASKTAMNAIQSDQTLEIGDVLDLARAAKAAQEARSLNLRERQAVAKSAREKLLEEQDANLQAEAKAQGMDEAQVDFWRRKVLGIRA